MNMLTSVLYLVLAAASAEPGGESNAPSSTAGASRREDANSTTGTAASPTDDKADFVSTNEFRAHHPAPADLDELLAVVSKTNRFLLKKARRGYSSYVTLTFPDHQVAYGRDYVFSAPRRLREIRAGYDAIATEPNNCIREKSRTDWPSWHCKPGRFDIGLEMIVPDAILKWDRRGSVCESGWCDVYRFTQASTKKDHGTILVSPNPDDRGVYWLFLRDDGTPIMLTEEGSGKEAQGLDWIVASYVYDFKTHVPPFSLPYAGRVGKSSR